MSESSETLNPREKIRQEWQARTAYGRIWFPVWLLGYFLSLVSVIIIVVAIVLAMNPAAPFHLLGKGIRWGCVQVASRLRGKTPAVYANEVSD